MNVAGWLDVLDFISQSQNTPLLSFFTNRLDNVVIEGISLLESLIKSKLTNLRSHSGLGQVSNGRVDIFHIIGGSLGINNLNVKYTINVKSHIIFSNCNL